MVVCNLLGPLGMPPTSGLTVKRLCECDQQRFESGKEGGLKADTHVKDL